MVREPLEPVRQRVILALRTPKGPEARARSLGNLRYLSGWLLEQGVSHEIAWVGDEGLRCLEVPSPEALTAVLREICLTREDAGALPWPLPLRAEWVCPVGQEGGGKL